jgi:hypothetical protein
MFEEKFVSLSELDQEEFARVVNALLLKSFIVRDMFDTRQRTMRINPDYRFIERYYSLINDYLKYAGWSITQDALNGVYALENSFEHNRIRIDRETSLIIYALRLAYEKNKHEGNQGGEAVYMTTPALLKMMLDYGITMLNKKITGRQLGRSLRFMALHNIIAKVAGSYDEGNVSFYILPSIIYAVDNAKIVAMSEALEQQRQSEQESEID